MRISKIEVSDLFGVFNHSIPMERPDRITIIHGPNGFGKTTILMLLHALFNRRYEDLSETPFSEFKVNFSDESRLEIRKPEGGKSPQLIATLVRPGKKQISVELASNFSRDKALFASREMASFIDRMDLRSPDLDAAVRDAYVHHIFADRLFLDQAKRKTTDKDEHREQIERFLKSIQVRFIKAQRLFHLNKAEENSGKKGSPMVYYVTHYAQELAAAIQGKLAEYAAKSQQLDRTFPRRAVEQCPGLQTTDSQLKERLSAIEKRRRILRDLGLLLKEDDADVQLGAQVRDPMMKNVLYLYAADVEEKLSVFDSIAEKISLFTEIIRGRFQYKELIIDMEKGFVFRTSAGDELPPTKLSSGEQHEVVMFYELLFQVTSGSLLLIDEPELSLHIAWQRQFLRDLERATKLVAFDVLLATHSPQVIHNRLDLLVRLEGREEQ